MTSTDHSVHLARETEDASVIVPKAMITSYLVNGATSFIMLVTYCFLLVDYDDVLESPAGLLGLPYVQVFVNATGSTAGGTAMVAILCIIAICGLCNWMASTARQVFAFARDHGLPFGDWIAKVDASGTYPISSVFVIWAVAVLLPLITLGSTIAFEALTSLQILALIFTYMISLSSILWRRFFGAPLPSSPWTLGPVAIPVNILGWCYCLYLIIFLPWPVIIPVAPANFNWASVMFIGIMVLASIYYLVWARKVYKGPVAYIRPRDE